MRLCRVSFAYESDGVTALYIDGKLHTHGDYYHDKIDDWINGFIEGLKYAGQQVTVASDQIPEEKCIPICQEGREPPAKWPDKKYHKHRVKP